MARIPKAVDGKYLFRKATGELVWLSPEDKIPPGATREDPTKALKKGMAEATEEGGLSLDVPPPQGGTGGQLIKGAGAGVGEAVDTVAGLLDTITNTVISGKKPAATEQPKTLHEQNQEALASMDKDSHNTAVKNTLNGMYQEKQNLFTAPVEELNQRIETLDASRDPRTGKFLSESTRLKWQLYVAAKNRNQADLDKYYLLYKQSMLSDSNPVGSEAFDLFKKAESTEQTGSTPDQPAKPKRGRGKKDKQADSTAEQSADTAELEFPETITDDIAKQEPNYKDSAIDVLNNISASNLEAAKTKLASIENDFKVRHPGEPIPRELELARAAVSGYSKETDTVPVESRKLMEAVTRFTVTGDLTKAQQAYRQLEHQHSQHTGNTNMPWASRIQDELNKQVEEAAASAESTKGIIAPEQYQKPLLNITRLIESGNLDKAQQALNVLDKQVRYETGELKPAWTSQAREDLELKLGQQRASAEKDKQVSHTRTYLKKLQEEFQANQAAEAAKRQTELDNLSKKAEEIKADIQVPTAHSSLATQVLTSYLNGDTEKGSRLFNELQAAVQTGGIGKGGQMPSWYKSLESKIQEMTPAPAVDPVAASIKQLEGLLSHAGASQKALIKEQITALKTAEAIGTEEARSLALKNKGDFLRQQLFKNAEDILPGSLEGIGKNAETAPPKTVEATLEPKASPAPAAAPSAVEETLAPEAGKRTSTGKKLALAAGGAGALGLAGKEILDEDTELAAQPTSKAAQPAPTKGTKVGQGKKYPEPPTEKIRAGLEKLRQLKKQGKPLNEAAIRLLEKYGE